VAANLDDVYGHLPAGESVQDVEWIEDCGKRGWIAITQNHRIGHTPVEIQAITDHETRVFSLKKADLTREEVGLVFGRYFLRMTGRARRVGGCFWRIGLDGDHRDVR